MKILVTGGAGFIASHIVDAYVNIGYSVVVVDNLSSGRKEFVNMKAKFYKADIRDGEKIDNIINKERPEVINHHAAQISVRESVENPRLDAQINIIGFLNILHAGVRSGLKRVIFASSGGVVYGEANKIPTPESYTPLMPLSPYGITKLTSEYYLHFFQLLHKVSYTALRYSNVYGPRQNPHGEAGVVAIFSQKLLRNEQPVINGDGKQTRDYVFINDVVEANILALTNHVNGVYNIGTGIETNVVEIFQLLKMICGNKIKALHGPAKKGEQERSCLDNKLAGIVLQWRSKISLYNGLQKTIAYFKDEKKV